MVQWLAMTLPKHKMNGAWMALGLDTLGWTVCSDRGHKDYLKLGEQHEQSQRMSMARGGNGDLLE